MRVLKIICWSSNHGGLICDLSDECLFRTLSAGDSPSLTYPFIAVDFRGRKSFHALKWNLLPMNTQIVPI